MHELPDRLETPEHYDKYWENIAESNKKIGHVPGSEKHIRYFDDLDKIKGMGTSKIILVVTPLPITYIDQKSDNIFSVPRYAFSVLIAIGSDKKKLNNALKETKLVHDQILGKLYKDSEPRTRRPFAYFKFEEITTEIWDVPVDADGWVGYSSSVPMGNPFTTIYNPEEWL